MIRRDSANVQVCNGDRRDLSSVAVAAVMAQSVSGILSLCSANSEIYAQICCWLVKKNKNNTFLQFFSFSYCNVK